MKKKFLALGLMFFVKDIIPMNRPNPLNPDFLTSIEPEDVVLYTQEDVQQHLVATIRYLIQREFPIHNDCWIDSDADDMFRFAEELRLSPSFSKDERDKIIKHSLLFYLLGLLDECSGSTRTNKKLAVIASRICFQLSGLFSIELRSGEQTLLQQLDWLYIPEKHDVVDPTFVLSVLSRVNERATKTLRERTSEANLNTKSVIEKRLLLHDWATSLFNHVSDIDDLLLDIT